MSQPRSGDPRSEIHGSSADGTPGDYILPYWGKTCSNQVPPGSSEYHPLAFHSLDVAAVGNVLLRRHPSLLEQIRHTADLEREDIAALATWMLALHDVGKFSEEFQNLEPELFLRLQGRTSTAVYRQRHDALGFHLLEDVLFALLPELSGCGAGESEDLWDLVLPWVAAVAGHHGTPPKRDLQRPSFSPVAKAAARAFLLDCARLFLPRGFPLSLDRRPHLERCSRRVSWLVAGLAVACDWIGSCVDWFPFRCDNLSPGEYWDRFALPQAEQALARTGLLPPTPAPVVSIRRIFQGITRETPLQEIAGTIPLGQGPHLALIEEVTGGGKTEAALLLAQRMMAAGLARGIYLALPTMATANAMESRIRPVFRNLFDEGCSASFVLAHSARDLAHPLESAGEPSHDPYEAGEWTGSADCTSWLGDSLKKALLADVGVGTVDQALLAVLPVRHQSMRLFGTLGKVLIVDEVHACDEYVRRLLCRLLHYHAAFGGSAILLSATLPIHQRRELLAAFHQGLGIPPPSLEEQAYPLLALASCHGAVEAPVSARPEASRSVVVRPVHTEDQVGETLRAALATGRCACWVRNTVADAVESFRRWRDLLGSDRVMLFHARFTMGDRGRIEQDVLRRFGPSGSARERAGRLLVATQVVEQSLDLDFDLMVTDLAPIDLILQRAGRLRRHARPRPGSASAVASIDDPPTLYVFGPEMPPKPAANWYSSFFPGGARVYPDHGRLWCTARWLQDHGGFAVPGDSREMVEFVYGDRSDESIPEALIPRTDKAEGERMAQESFALANALELDAGYAGSTGYWGPDEFTPTRLGDPAVTVRLVRRVGERLLPWHDGTDRPWRRSDLRVAWRRLAREDPSIPPGEIDALRRAMPDHGRHRVLLILEQEGGGWHAAALDGVDRRVRVTYDPEIGLEVEHGG